jgi:hypothetical protein
VLVLIRHSSLELVESNNFVFGAYLYAYTAKQVEEYDERFKTHFKKVLKTTARVRRHYRVAARDRPPKPTVSADIP